MHTLRRGSINLTMGAPLMQTTWYQRRGASKIWLTCHTMMLNRLYRLQQDDLRSSRRFVRMRVTFFIFCAVLETACTQRIHIPSGYMANADPSQSSTADSVNSASAGAQWKNIAVLIDAQ